MATPLTSGGKVSVIIASFMGFLLWCE